MKGVTGEAVGQHCEVGSRNMEDLQESSREGVCHARCHSARSGRVRTDLTFGLSHVEMVDRLDKQFL